MAAGLLEDLAVASGAPVRRRRSARRGGRRLLGLAVPLLLLALWQLVSAAELISPRLLPSPSDVAEQLRLFFFGEPGTLTLAGVVPFTGAGTDHVLSSLRRAGTGWLLAVAVGTVVGLAIGLSSLARDLLDPVLNALRAVPIFAWLPLALVWFGIGEGAARALIFIGALWPVLVAVGDATARVPRGHVETARMLGTPEALALATGLPAVRAAGGRHRPAAVADPGVDRRHRRRAVRDHLGRRRDDERRARERPYRPGGGRHPRLRRGRPAGRRGAPLRDPPLGALGRCMRTA